MGTRKTKKKKKNKIKPYKGKGDNMGNVKNYFQDWLDRGGYSLGYDLNHAPDLSDLDWIIDHDIDADDYFSCAGLEVNK